jgi:hypothetical protein
MNFRNPKYTKNNWIDCEIEHPRLGWIPFTCNPNDEGAAFDTKELFDRMVASKKVAAYIPPTQAELEAKQMEIVRVKRDALLRESDILVFPDRWATYTSQRQAEISAYRQALRDLPENITDPFNVTWPVLANP